MAWEYANYVWMLTGDLAAADAVLDRAFHAGGEPSPLLVAKAALYHAAGLDLNRKVLADVALHDDAAFRNLAELAKSALAVKDSALLALEKE